MKKITESEALREKIMMLQLRQTAELQLLKTQMHFTYESLKPINLIKNAFHEVASSSEVKNSLVNNAIGLATGYLSKKVLIGGTRNPFKKILGAVLEFSIASFVAKRADKYQSAETESTD